MTSHSPETDKHEAGQRRPTDSFFDWFTRKEEPVKWLAYGRLLEAFSPDGCAICKLVARQSVRHLETILNEGLMDAGVRTRLYDSLGLCNLHGWIATRMPFGDVGLAILYKDLLGLLLPHFDRLAGALQPPFAHGLIGNFWRRREALAAVPATADCPICSANALTAHIYLGELLKFFDDPELRAAYDASFGICLPHLQQALNDFPDEPRLTPLIVAERAKLAALQAELREYDARRDYRFHDKPHGREQSSWWRVIEKFTGKRERPGGQHE
jgi:hypothetical protein